MCLAITNKRAENTITKMYFEIQSLNPLQINDKIEELFTDFIFMTAKFRTDFDSATVASPDFLDLRNSTSNQIFQDISSTEHYGFFIFSYFDDLCQEINKILDSPLFLLYSPNEIISLISEFSILSLIWIVTILRCFLVIII